MSTNLEQQIQTGVQAVYAKASNDPVFRQLCLSDAKAAIKVATGLETPAGLKVRFVDGNDAHLTFVLPGTKSASGELKDEDLEHVSGGDGKVGSQDLLSTILRAQREKEAADARARLGANAGIGTTTAAVGTTTAGGGKGLRG
jgi:hypothetical protein